MITLPPFPFQDVGSDFLAARTRAGLFDEMGVGKTAQAIFAMDKIGAQRAIIVAPAGVHKAGVWQGEFKKFGSRPRRVLKHRKIDDIQLFLKGRCDVLLMSYEGVVKHGRKLERDVTDVIVCDESHALKTPSSQRTLAMFGQDCKGKHGLGRWGAYHWSLTGTPIPNDPVDIWSWLRFVGGTPLNLAPFTARYFSQRMSTYGAQSTVRAEAVRELQQAIAAFCLCRTAEQVGLQLPPIWMTSAVIDGDTSEIVALLRQHPGLEQTILDAAEAGGLSKLADMVDHIATLRRLIGEAKAPAYVELIDYELKNGHGKIVTMGLHTKALHFIVDEMRKRGHGVVLIDGTVTGDTRRVQAIKAFQEDPTIRLAVCNSKAAGVAITLTAAASIDMFEEDWTPAINAQAIKRVHRIGQEQTVRARFISLANSLDQHVSDTNARKTAQIARIQTGLAA